MKNSLLFLLLSVTILSADGHYPIIPKPQKLIPKAGTFTLSQQTHYLSDTTRSNYAIAYLQHRLRLVSGYTLKRVQKRENRLVRFHYAPKKVKKAEAYRLAINPDGILIEARDQAGFLYAVMSLLQLMPPEIWRESPAKSSVEKWEIPSCNIEDYPRFSWRGMMLDTSRNFFSKKYIKKFIDRMAQHKLNRFHWHLTDDEGWRIEIKRYPLLTKIGATRGPGTLLPFSTYPAMRGSKQRVESGYYTQKEIREIVNYAKARSIEILPEIDIPAHAKAAVTAYPNLLLDPQDRSHYRSVQKISNNTINPGLESSYVFLDHVIEEVTKLFPFGYIHLGGDEVPKGAWRKSPAVKKLKQKKNLKNSRAVQDYFFTRMDKILARHHRRMIVWQEVLHGAGRLRKETIYMAWKNRTSGIKATQQRQHVIMAPVQYLYFDQQYVRNRQEPGHTWSTPVTTEKTYSLHPGNSPYIRGVHACLWSETLLNEKIADYLAWPRTLALAELGWTRQEKRNWKAFQRRASDKGLKRLKVQGIHFRPIIPIK